MSLHKVRLLAACTCAVRSTAVKHAHPGILMHCLETTHRRKALTTLPELLIPLISGMARRKVGEDIGVSHALARSSSITSMTIALSVMAVLSIVFGKLFLLMALAVLGTHVDVGPPTRR